jgi:hypothetical protein
VAARAPSSKGPRLLDPVAVVETRAVRLLLDQLDHREKNRKGDCMNPSELYSTLNRELENIKSEDF